MAPKSDSLPFSVVPPPRLEVVDLGPSRLVRVGGHPVACYQCDDAGSERVVATQLAETSGVKAGEVAAAFGMHPVTLSRYRGQLRAGGAQALMPRRSGPKGPHKVTPKMAARFQRLRREGLSLRGIAKRVSRGGREISYGTVAAVLRSVREEEPEELGLGEIGQIEMSAAEETTVKTEAVGKTAPAFQTRAIMEEAALETSAEAVRSGAEVDQDEEEQHDEADGGAEKHEVEAKQEQAGAQGSERTRYAGALMLFAGLAQLNLWSILRGLGASAGPSRRWGWAETAATVVLCFALRFRSIEDSKNALRRDLGVLLGQSWSPGLLTLRQKITTLAESIDPVALSRELFRRYLALEPVWEGLYYVDGHFCPYYGEHPTPQGWDAKRRLASKGHNDLYVHDVRGRALFFLSQPLNDSLARAIAGLVAEIRQAHGQGPFTLIFDRGGYSGDVFRFLKQQGIGFITYLKGRKARRRYPKDRFAAGWFRFEGQRHSYRLYEKKTRVTRAGTIRTVLFLGDDDHQIPVLTNLTSGCKPAKVVHCLRLRWRQENSFKYLSEHYGIEQIIQYGADPEQADRQVPNPRRKVLKERIQSVTEQIQALEAQLGRALDQNDEARRPTARGLKIAYSPLRHQLDQQRQLLTRLENRLRHTPAQISAALEHKTRSLLREDRRLVVNALKLVAYNAERMLALRFQKHYDRAQDVFSVFRALFHLPGEVRRVDDDHLEITLDLPDSPKVANALRPLLSEINAQSPRLFQAGPTLTFTLPC